MQQKKFSELNTSKGISDDDILPISSANGINGFTSEKLSVGQLKKELGLFQIQEIDDYPPLEEDVLISINGYRLKASRDKEHVFATYPTKIPKIPRMVPVVSGFRAVAGKTYYIPFSASNLILSNLTIKSDSKFFTTLKVTKLDDSSGVITIVTNRSRDSIEEKSIITVTDEISQTEMSVVIIHTMIIAAINLNSISVSNNTIDCVWSIHDNSLHVMQGAILPKVTVTPAIKHRIIYDSDYFNQIYFYKKYSNQINPKTTIILEEPYSGELNIELIDTLQSVSAHGSVVVNYQVE